MLRLLLFGTLLLGALQNVPPIGMRGGTLTGEVRLPSGGPAAGVRVAALEAPILADGDPAGASVLAGLAMTDAAGRYRLEDVAPGRYFIVAGDLDNLVYRPTPVMVVAGATIEVLNFSLSDHYDGAIEVVVHLAGSSQPVPGALVSIRSPEAVPPSYLMFGINAGTSLKHRTVATNFEGIASFSGIPYGDYSVSTPALSIRDILSGVTPQPGAAQRELSLQVSINPERQRWKVSLGILRPAEISGTVRDSAGIPVQDALVEGMGIGYRNGRSMLEAESSTRTDRFGEYTLPTALGEHYIRVSPSIESALPVTYYPSTGDPGGVKPLVVGNGAQVKDVDIRLGKTFKVAGVVTNVSADATVPELFLTSRSGIDVSIPPFANGAVAGGGAFEIAGVPVGAWDLHTIVQDPSVQRPRTGRIPIDVVDKGIEGLSIALSSGGITGRVIVDGSSLDLQNIWISLTPKDGLPVHVSDALPGTQIPNARGEFSFLNVPALKYGVQVSGVPLGGYVSDLRVAGNSIFSDNTLTVTADAQTQLDIIVSSGAGRVEGTVAGIGASAQLALSAQVVLVPDAPRRQNALLYRTAPIRPDGSFTIVPHVAPGNYKIFALPRLPASRPELNPGFIAKYEDAAISFTVLPNEVVRPDLKLTPLR